MAKEREDQGQTLIQSAVAQGIEAIVRKHPHLKEQGQRIADHVDSERIRESVSGIEQYIRLEEENREKPFSPEERTHLIHRGLAEYVASGAVLDDTGKELFLRESLENRAKRGPRKWDAREELKGEQHLQKVGVAFRELYEMFKTGDYAQHMPDVARAVATVRNLGFLSPALNLMRHYGLIDKNRYKFIKKNILTKVAGSVKETENAMARYSAAEQEPSQEYASRQHHSDQYSRAKEKKVVPFPAGLEKIAAVVLGIAGIVVMLFSGTRFTGGAIGVSSGAQLLPLAGIFLCVAAWLLFVKMRRSRSTMFK